MVMPTQALLKLKRLIRRLGDLFPPSWRGVLVALFSAVALWRFGLGDLDLLLFVVGISGLVLVVACALLTTGAALYLRRHLGHANVGAQRLEAGSPIRTGFEVPALTRLPLVKVHWEWLRPHGVDCRIRLRDRTFYEEVVATHRGQTTAVRRRFFVYDAFGLSRVAWEREDPTPLTILPHVGRLRNMPVVQSLAATEGTPHPAGVPEGDRMEIRRYVPGDSARHILWKTYARTRQLNVRTPERSIDPSRKTVAYLVTGEDDEAAAAAARVALETGALGLRWLFCADGTDQPADALETALQAIARSGSLADGSGNGHGGRGGLSAFLRHPEVRNEVHCIVFAPARSGVWTDEALQATRSFAGSLSFVLATDGLVRRGPTPLWRRLLFDEAEPAGTTSDELAELLRTVGGAGCPALVVDRESGRAYGQHHQRAIGAA